MFRDAVDIDFDGVDYFALVGPTGAGKSTVIDAICFALVRERAPLRRRAAGRARRQHRQAGSEGLAHVRRRRAAVPRDACRAHPQRQGEHARSAARTHRADGPPTVLAGSARELKPAVERLLGLPFAHFTKCVVLPQGEFARFLHDEPAKRRDLLTKLLDFEVYDRIGALARQRGRGREVGGRDPRTAARRVRRRNRRRARRGRGPPGRAPRTAPRARHRPPRGPAADRRDRRSRRAGARRVRAGGRAGTGPGAARGHAAHREARRCAGRGTRRDRSASRPRNGRSLRSTPRSTSLPDRAELARAQEAHVAVAALGPALEDARTAEAAAATDAERVADLATRAEAHLGGSPGAARRGAATRTPRTRWPAHLVAGEPCPVCRQTVTDIPKRKRPAALTKIEGEVKEARRIAAGTREAVEQATHAHADAAAARKQLEEQLAAQQALTDAFPDAATIADALDAHRRDAGGAPGGSDARAGRARRRSRGRDPPRGGRRAARRAAFRAAPAARPLRAGRTRSAGGRGRPRRRVDRVRRVVGDRADRTAVERERGVEGARTGAYRIARSRSARSSNGPARCASSTRAKDLAALRDDVLEHGRDAAQRAATHRRRARTVPQDRRGAARRARGARSRRSARLALALRPVREVAARRSARHPRGGGCPRTSKRCRPASTRCGPAATTSSSWSTTATPTRPGRCARSRAARRSRRRSRSRSR